MQKKSPKITAHGPQWFAFVTAASNEGMAGLMDFFLGKYNYDPVLFSFFSSCELHEFI